jgi:hypothetical protein
LPGGFAASKLTPLLSNTFTVPGTDSERARAILQERFGDRSDGEFLDGLRGFLVTRMRETWDEEHDNVRAVSYGLERTGIS